MVVVFRKGVDFERPFRKYSRNLRKAQLFLISSYFRDEANENDTQSFSLASPTPSGTQRSNEVQTHPAEGGNQTKKTPEWVSFVWLQGWDLPACGRSCGAEKPATGRFSDTRPSNPPSIIQKTKHTTRVCFAFWHVAPI